VLRILPLYYLGLLCYDVVLPRLMGQGVVSFSDGWWYWIFLQGIPLTLPGTAGFGPPHYWSLAVEEHFYLVWPWVVALVPPRRLPGASLAILVITVACRWVFIRHLDLGTFFATPCRLDGLALGAFLASAESGDLAGPATDLIRRWSPALSAVLAVVLLGLWTRLSRSGSWPLGVFKLA
jgi:peptidoglycan/LPS O-acetylase OafA/YrhL